jgi:hypothetical protein
MYNVRLMEMSTMNPLLYNEHILIKVNKKTKMKSLPGTLHMYGHYYGLDMVAVGSPKDHVLEA